MLTVPDLGRLRIQSLTAAELRKITHWANSDGNGHKIDEKLISMCLVDGDGKRLYASGDVDTGTFDTWDAAIVRGLGDACDRWTGYRQEAFDFGRIEAAKKN